MTYLIKMMMVITTAFMMFVVPASAQESVETVESLPAEMPAPIAPEQPKPVQWTLQKSLFMTPNEITSILQARQGKITPREAYDEENQFDPIDSSSPRILSLAGIVYVDRNDWTIWLNGERVTPANIPDHVIDLTVKSDRIHLKWFDIREQRVVVVTLRSHQRYDLDSGLMMPGT